MGLQFWFIVVSIKGVLPEQKSKLKHKHEYGLYEKELETIPTCPGVKSPLVQVPNIAKK